MPLSRILAAVDPANPLAAEGLDDAVMEAAASIARMSGGELHVLHAWTVFGETSLERQLPSAHLSQHVQECQGRAATALRDLLERYRDHVDPSRVLLVKGHPLQVIPRHAGRIGADVIVVGTSARCGLRRIIVGNTAEDLMFRTSAQLVVVKAPSFRPRLRPALPRATAHARTRRVGGRAGRYRPRAASSRHLDRWLPRLLRIYP